MLRCADFCNFCREVSVIASFTFDTQLGNCGIGRGESKPGSGSGVPNKNKVGKVTNAQVREIAVQKMPDLNTTSVEAAIRSVEGTARSMGITVVD